MTLESAKLVADIWNKQHCYGWWLESLVYQQNSSNHINILAMHDHVYHSFEYSALVFFLQNLQIFRHSCFVFVFALKHSSNVKQCKVNNQVGNVYVYSTAQNRNVNLIRDIFVSKI